MTVPALIFYTDRPIALLHVTGQQNQQVSHPICRFVTSTTVQLP